MTHTRLWIVATIIASIILAGFALSVPRARDGVLPSKVLTEEGIIPAVSVHDVFRKGVHTITGSLKASNACTGAQAEASIVNGGILVNITMPIDSSVCLQEETIVTFSTTITAPSNQPIQTTVNGIVATTTEK